MAHRFGRGLRAAARTVLFHQQLKPINNSNHVFQQPIRNYMSTSEMRKAAFEENILRLIRYEIQYEIDNSPPSQHVPEFKEFTVDERPGKQWIRLTRKFGENEEIKVEATLFDKSIPIKEDDDTTDDIKNPVPLIISIFKGKDNAVLEFLCYAWPDSIAINNLYTRGHDQTHNQSYMGPGFEELDDNLQYALYDFLEERGIDDNFGNFLHHYTRMKGKNEYIRWMEKVKSVLQKK